VVEGRGKFANAKSIHMEDEEEVRWERRRESEMKEKRWKRRRKDRQ